MKEIKPNEELCKQLELLKIAEEEIKIFMGVPRRYLGTVKDYTVRGTET